MKTSIFLLLILPVSLSASAQHPPKGWIHLSTAKKDLPLAWKTTQQTAALVVDLDKDGINDFVLGCRVEAPVLIWYRRHSKGWTSYIIEPEFKTIEAGGSFADIDNDGDMDLVFGNDWQGN
jgi:hypothetical protein